MKISPKWFPFPTEKNLWGGEKELIFIEPIECVRSFARYVTKSRFNPYKNPDLLSAFCRRKTKTSRGSHELLKPSLLTIKELACWYVSKPKLMLFPPWTCLFFHIHWALNNLLISNCIKIKYIIENKLIIKIIIWHYLFSICIDAT